MDRILEDVVAACDHARFLALRKQRAEAGGREERADACAGRADALGEVALWHELKLDLAAAVESVEHVRIGLPGKRADDLAHTSRLEQRGESRVSVAGIVVDDGEVARALDYEGVDELGGHAGCAEAADHDGGTVVDIGHGSGCGGNDFVDHGRQMVEEVNG